MKEQVQETSLTLTAVLGQIGEKCSNRNCNDWVGYWEVFEWGF